MINQVHGIMLTSPLAINLLQVQHLVYSISSAITKNCQTGFSFGFEGSDSEAIDLPLGNNNASVTLEHLQLLRPHNLCHCEKWHTCLHIGKVVVSLDHDAIVLAQ